MKKYIASALLIFAGSVFAGLAPKGLITDQRIKVVSYDPDNVVIVDTTYGFATTIELEKGEYIVEGLAIGKSTGWFMSSPNNANFLVVKPKVSGNTTNINFMTNKGRNYTFLLRASETESRNTFRVRFVYDDMRIGMMSSVRQLNNLIRHFGDPSETNNEYSFAGDKWIAPIMAKDNGTFTLMRFKPGSPIPAILSVDPVTRKEALVNFRMQNGYVVIDGVKPQYSLRYGDHVTCLFNERVLKEWKSEGRI